MEEWKSLAHTCLVGALRREGLPARKEGGRVFSGLGSLNCECFASQTTAHPTIVVTALGIMAGVDGSRDLEFRDVSIGIADSLENSIRKSVQYWVEGMWPPVRALFSGGRMDGRCTAMLLSLTGANQSAWLILAGTPKAGGAKGSLVEELQRRVEAHPPWAFVLEALWRVLDANPVRVRALRILSSRQPDGRIAAECRMNNDDWPAGFEGLQRFPWPPSPEFLQFGQYVLFIPMVVAARVGCEPDPDTRRLVAEMRRPRPWWAFW